MAVRFRPELKANKATYGNQQEVSNKSVGRQVFSLRLLYIRLTPLI
jgi:hypothetical protein